MEISLISSGSIKIRAKNASFVINPSSEIKNKTTADAVLGLVSGQALNLSNLEEYRLRIQGAGEYEAGGAKIYVQQVKGQLVYNFLIEGTDMLFSSSRALSDLAKKKESSVIILYSMSVLEASFFSEFSPRLLLFYGEKAKEQAVAIEKQFQSVSKYSFTQEKLPDEMQIVVLE